MNNNNNNNNKLLFLVGIIPLLLIPLVNAVPAVSITRLDDSHPLVLVGKPLLYVNGTNYHIKGVLKSVAKYTLPNVGLFLEFMDKKTGNLITGGNSMVTAAITGTNIGSMSPNQTRNFDIDTSYTKVQGDKDFPYFNITIGAI